VAAVSAKPKPVFYSFFLFFRVFFRAKTAAGGAHHRAYPKSRNALTTRYGRPHGRPERITADRGM